MKIFYGAAIQGARIRGEKSKINKELIDFIKINGFEVISEHTTWKNKEETVRLLEKSIGYLPKEES